MIIVCESKEPPGMERSFKKEGKLVIWKYDDCQWLVVAGSSFLQIVITWSYATPDFPSEKLFCTIWKYKQKQTLTTMNFPDLFRIWSLDDLLRKSVPWTICKNCLYIWRTTWLIFFFKIISFYFFCARLISLGLKLSQPRDFLSMHGAV